LNPSFAVVIPVFNHGRTVAGMVRQCVDLGFTVFVVDDGSDDLDKAVFHGWTGMRFLRHQTNLGKGAALMTGFRAAAAAGFSWAVTLDADGQHRPEDAAGLIAAVPQETRPVIVGCRQQMLDAGAPWTSRFGRGFSNFWIRRAGGPRTSDTQSGFRIYPLPEVMDLGVQAGRYQFELEVLVKARWSGMPVIEAPVSVVYQPEGGRISHFHPFSDFMRNSAMFARLIVQRIFGCRPNAFRTRRTDG
jgi:glycosyltransferase involved in cell wall biosynthesis